MWGVGRQLVLKPGCFATHLSLPFTCSHKTHQHLSLADPPSLHALPTRQSGPASPPLSFGFLRFPSFFFRVGSDAHYAHGLRVLRLPLRCGVPPIARHMCAREVPRLACLRVGGFAERRPPMSPRGLHWALICGAFVMYVRLPAKKMGETLLFFSSWTSQSMK